MTRYENRSNIIDRKEVSEMEKEPSEDKKKALQELLKVLCDNPEIADRITITIRPNRIKQGTDKPK